MQAARVAAFVLGALSQHAYICVSETVSGTVCQYNAALICREVWLRPLSLRYWLHRGAADVRGGGDGGGSQSNVVCEMRQPPGRGGTVRPRFTADLCTRLTDRILHARLFVARVRPWACICGAQWCSCLNLNLQSLAREVFQSADLDVDGSGSVSFPEFLQWARK
jgi:hypothetical protein